MTACSLNKRRLPQGRVRSGKLTRWINAQPLIRGPTLGPSRPTSPLSRATGRPQEAPHSRSFSHLQQRRQQRRLQLNLQKHLHSHYQPAMDALPPSGSGAGAPPPGKNSNAQGAQQQVLDLFGSDLGTVGVVMALLLLGMMHEFMSRNQYICI